LTPEKIFEARWALTLLNHAMTVLRQEYVARGKESVFDTLKAFAGIGESRPEASYEEAAKGLDIGVGTVKTLIHRLRRHYLAVVREEVARAVSNPAEIDGEIRALCDALIAAEGRPPTGDSVPFVSCAELSAGNLQRPRNQVQYLGR
jgi:uncharacterized protein YnzC (UPF0291/DUF896 family)